MDKMVENNLNLYFVEGFYGKHYLIKMSPFISEVKMSYELLNLLKVSHDEGIPIKNACEKILGDKTNSKCLNQILNQISWLNEKGMINLI